MRMTKIETFELMKREEEEEEGCVNLLLAIAEEMEEN